MRSRKHKGIRKVFNAVTIGAFVMVVLTAAPLVWLVLGSLKSATGMSSPPPKMLTAPFIISNFVEVFTQHPFAHYLLNSVIVAVASTIVVLGLGCFAGYALARMPVKGKYPIMVGLLMISVFPSLAVVTPLFVMERSIGWLNSYQGLIVPYVAFNLPFAIWILRNYMLGIPKEMEESARVDGASPTRTVVSIVLPAARPGIFTAGVFTFTATWTEFLMALTFNNADTFRTVPVGIADFGSEFSTPYGTIFAASVMAVLPIAIIVLVFKRFVVSGLTSGAVKG
jgi:multiple sugar transport system permease protein